MTMTIRDRETLARIVFRCGVLDVAASLGGICIEAAGIDDRLGEVTSAEWWRACGMVFEETFAKLDQITGRPIL